MNVHYVRGDCLLDANWWHKFNCLIAAAGTFEKVQDASWKLVNPGFDSNLCYTTLTSALGFIPGRKEVLGEGGHFPWDNWIVRHVQEVLSNLYNIHTIQSWKECWNFNYFCSVLYLRRRKKSSIFLLMPEHIFLVTNRIRIHPYLKLNPD